jgi:hypothetical protein
MYSVVPHPREYYRTITLGFGSRAGCHIISWITTCCSLLAMPLLARQHTAYHMDADIMPAVPLRHASAVSLRPGVQSGCRQRLLGGSVCRARGQISWRNSEIATIHIRCEYIDAGSAVSELQALSAIEECCTMMYATRAVKRSGAHSACSVTGHICTLFSCASASASCHKLQQPQHNCRVLTAVVPASWVLAHICEQAGRWLTAVVPAGWAPAHICEQAGHWLTAVVPAGWAPAHICEQAGRWLTAVVQAGWALAHICWPMHERQQQQQQQQQQSSRTCSAGSRPNR